MKRYFSTCHAGPGTQLMYEVHPEGISQSRTELVAPILSPANCEIPVWSDDGTGNALKTEPMCVTEDRSGRPFLVTPELMESVRQQFCRTGASQFRNSLVNSPRGLAKCWRNRLPMAGKSFYNDGEVQTAVASWLQKLAIDSCDIGRVGFFLF